MRNVLLLLLASLLVLVPLAAPAGELDNLKRQLGQQFAAQDLTAAAATIAQIGALDNVQAAEFLMENTFAHPSSTIYEAGRDAITGMRSPEVRAWILKQAAKGKTWQVRTAMYEILAGIRDDAQVEQTLIDGLAEERVNQIVTICARALAARLSTAAVDPMINALERVEGEKDVLWVDLLTALNDITGKNLGTAAEWRQFWRIAKATFNPQTDRAHEDIQGTVAREAPTFFAEKILSKRIMFIIDVSGSMREVDPPSDTGPGGKRIDRAKKELEESLRHLDQNTYFNILAFDDHIRVWQERLQLASNRAKADAIVFTQNLRENGMTHTDEALVKAFEDPNINAIYLLTDGVPMKMDQRTMEQNIVPPQQIMEQVERLNRFRKVKIYTLGFEAIAKEQDGEQFVQFLKDLAEHNGGTYRAIN